MEKPILQGQITYITKSVEFSAAHFYYVDSWSKEKNLNKFGPCSNRQSHGHNYKLDVTIMGLVDTTTGMIINLIDLKHILTTKILNLMDHKNLNHDIDYFKDNLPTTENLCKVIWDILSLDLSASLAKITVHENENLLSYYKGENDLIYLTRIYNFSASHRLYNQSLSDDDNRNIFGKCNNYNSHGHNFRLEVTIKGETDPITGMIFDLCDLDKIVNSEIISKLDYQCLNDLEEFQNKVTTGENITKVIWDKLKNMFNPAKLYKIKLYETDRNYFEYLGE